MASQAAELARRLARDAEAVCRCYLSNGRREGRYWLDGDVGTHRSAACSCVCTVPSPAKVRPVDGPTPPPLNMVICST